MQLTTERHVPIPKRVQSVFAFLGVTGAALLGAYLMSEQIPLKNGQDEAYYTMAAQTYAQWHCTPRDDLLCNLEHPPLAKILIGFSYNWTGNFRTFNIIMAASIASMTYLIALKLLRSEKAALIAGLLIALDGYFFYTTAVANLEAPMIAFALAALLSYLYLEDRPRLRLLVVILLLSLALFSKYSAAFDAFALAIYHFIRTRKIVGTVLIAIVPFALSVAYLEPYDLAYTGFASSIDHIKWMMGFHVVASTVPGQFWLGDLKSWTPVNYFFMFGEIEGTDHKVGALAAVAGITMPLAYLYLRRQGQSAKYSAATTVAVVFFAAFLVEMTALHLDGRILYLYYTPEIMPIIALSAGWLALFVNGALRQVNNEG